VSIVVVVIFVVVVLIVVVAGVVVVLVDVVDGIASIALRARGNTFFMMAELVIGAAPIRPSYDKMPQ